MSGALILIDANICRYYNRNFYSFSVDNYKVDIWDKDNTEYPFNT